MYEYQTVSSVMKALSRWQFLLHLCHAFPKGSGLCVHVTLTLCIAFGQIPLLKGFWSFPLSGLVEALGMLT